MFKSIIEMQEKKIKELQPLVDEANWIADEL